MYNFLQWLRINTNVHFDILLLNEGPLTVDFKQIGNVYFWNAPPPKKPNLIRRIYNRVLGINYDPQNEFYKRLTDELISNHYDVIYGNTIVSLDVLCDLRQQLQNIKTILHVHELHDLTLEYTQQLKALMDFPNTEIIAVSELNRQNLIVNHHIEPASISLIYEYIDLRHILESKTAETAEKFVVNGSGMAHWRKGYDIFIAVAKRAVQKYPDIPFHFKWIGLIPNQHSKFFIKNDLEQAGLTSYVSFMGELKNPYKTYSEASVFLMTSRLDPFPLVCLEHAALQKPIVCFDKGTGISEFVEEDAGIVVPYLDVEAMTDALFFLYHRTETREAMGKTAAQKVSNYDIHVQAPKILDLINGYSNQAK